jgi:hypothetical protein
MSLEKELAMTICAEIESLADDENCGIANNWLPVIAKALIPPEHVRNQNEIFYNFQQMSSQVHANVQHNGNALVFD